MEKTDWTPEENPQEATKLKEQGNQQFSQKSYKQALKFYHKAKHKQR